MKRRALLAFAAAGAITAIVVLTTGAIAGGGTSGRSNQPGDDNAALISCMASHGVQVPNNDPGAVKRWLGDHQTDPAVHAALDACAPGWGSNTGVSGPTPAEHVACLEQHGVDVPSDVKNAPDTLKEWLHGAMEQPGVKAALGAC